jgi:hypothetical protein
MPRQSEAVADLDRLIEPARGLFKGVNEHPEGCDDDVYLALNDTEGRKAVANAVLEYRRSYIRIISTFNAPALDCSFSVAQAFRPHSWRDGRWHLHEVSEEFLKNFSGVTVQKRGEVRLESREILKRGITYQSIIRSIGEDTFVTTDLGAVYELVSLQPKGEPGPLTTANAPNIFFVRQSNVLYEVWLVHQATRTKSLGWTVTCHAEQHRPSERLNPGARIFSRAPVVS